MNTGARGPRSRSMDTGIDKLDAKEKQGKRRETSTVYTR